MPDGIEERRLVIDVKDLDRGWFFPAVPDGMPGYRDRQIPVLSAIRTHAVHPSIRVQNSLNVYIDCSIIKCEIDLFFRLFKGNLE
jgi:hypothetical protein